MNYTIATATHVGRLRDNNEDSVYPVDDSSTPGPVVVAVADGMGGHAAGEVASTLAIEGATSLDQGSAVDRVQAANDAVLGAASNDPSLVGMGTTLTLAIFWPDGRLEIGHVGDSRAYLWRNERLTQLTIDHTFVRELIAQGRLTPEDAETHPRRHMLTRTIGMGNVRADALDIHLLPNDRVMLCSDGLTNMIDDEQIQRILANTPIPSGAVWSLVEAANAAGGHDNTTVAVVDVTE
ncbi:MAG: serine/threonine-protein phosphatase [Acidimicrobiia bacterium]|nr:serine/threonine-protein phosphatase [Acidimicrobiia bacterium]